MRWSMPRKAAFEAFRRSVSSRHLEFNTTLTVSADDELVSRRLVEESALVEQLVVGLVVVGKGDLDFTILNLGQSNRERSLPLLQIDGSRAGSGHEGSESGDSDLHVVGWER